MDLLKVAKQSLKHEEAERAPTDGDCSAMYRYILTVDIDGARRKIDSWLMYPMQMYSLCL